MDSVTKRILGAIGAAMPAWINTDFASADDVREARRRSDMFRERSPGIGLVGGVFIDELTTRDILKSGTAGNLIGTTTQDVVDVPRVPATVRAGAQVVTPDFNRDLVFPRVTTDVTVEWHVEGTGPSTSTPLYGTAAGSPKILTGSVDMSRKLALTSDGVQQVSLQLLGALWNGLDKAAFHGGTDAPTGIIATSGVNTSTAATFNIAHASTHSNSLSDRADPERVRWIFNPTNFATLSSRPVVSGGDVMVARDGKILEYPVIRSRNLTAGNLVVGDFSNMLLVVWGIEILIDPISVHAGETIRIMGHLYADVVIIDPAAFSIATDLS